MLTHAHGRIATTHTPLILIYSHWSSADSDDSCWLLAELSLTKSLLSPSSFTALILPADWNPPWPSAFSFFYSLSCYFLARSCSLVLFRLRNSAFLRYCLASAIFSTFYDKSVSRRDFICTGYFRGKLCHDWPKIAVNLAISLGFFLLSSISVWLQQFLYSSVTVLIT